MAAVVGAASSLPARRRILRVLDGNAVAAAMAARLRFEGIAEQVNN
jgi:hypothetical protein